MTSWNIVFVSASPKDNNQWDTNESSIVAELRDIVQDPVRFTSHVACTWPKLRSLLHSERIDILHIYAHMNENGIALLDDKDLTKCNEQRIPPKFILDSLKHRAKFHPTLPPIQCIMFTGCKSSRIAKEVADSPWGTWTIGTQEVIRPPHSRVFSAQLYRTLTNSKFPTCTLQQAFEDAVLAVKHDSLLQNTLADDVFQLYSHSGSQSLQQPASVSSSNQSSNFQPGSSLNQHEAAKTQNLWNLEMYSLDIKQEEFTQIILLKKTENSILMSAMWRQRKVVLKMCLSSQTGFEQEIYVAFSSPDSQHPNILPAYGCCQDFTPPKAVCAQLKVQYPSKPCLVLPFVEGTSLDNPVPLQPGEIPRLALEAAQALEFLHSHGILHRDVSARNLLLAREGSNSRLVLFDFSLARLATSCVYRVAHPQVPLPERYLAPELLLQDTPHVFTFQTDVWMLGIALWQMCCVNKAEPFEKSITEPFKEQARKVLAARLPLSLDESNLNAECPEIIRQLIRECLFTDPQQRITVAEIIKALQNPAAYIPRVPKAVHFAETQDTVTDIVILLDESESMEVGYRQILGAVNVYITDQQRSLEGTAYLSILKFSTSTTWYAQRQLLSSVSPIPDEHYYPNGSTALLDAIGVSITELRTMTSRHVVFIIVTDGEENASRTYKKEQVRTLLRDQRKAGWEFIFLAANEEAFLGAKDVEPEVLLRNQRIFSNKNLYSCHNTALGASECTNDLRARRTMISVNGHCGRSSVQDRAWYSSQLQRQKDIALHYSLPTMAEEVDEELANLAFQQALLTGPNLSLSLSASPDRQLLASSGSSSASSLSSTAATPQIPDPSTVPVQLPDPSSVPVGGFMVAPTVSATESTETKESVSKGNRQRVQGKIEYPKHTWEEVD